MGEAEESEAIEPSIVETPTIRMSYFQLLQLLKKQMESGRIDLAVAAVSEAIDQLEARNNHVREPKLQDEESPKGSSSEG